MVICCAGAVSHSASASAAAWFFPAFGTPSHEPPQLAAPPGRFAMSQSPDTAWPACEVMYPVIHDGQEIVANAPLANAWFHGVENCERPAVILAWAAFVASA